MTWLFSECSDLYGSCIRQYIFFALALVIAILALYSCIKVYQQSQKLIFQLLPLAINTLTALALVGIYSQIEVLNIRVILLIIEIYSYFILSYGFIYMVTVKKGGSSCQLNIVKLVFSLFTLLCIGALALTVFFSIMQVISCEQDQGIGSIVLIGFQVPLLIATCIYSNKSKAIIQQRQSESTSFQRNTVVNQEQYLKKVKLIQLRLIIWSLILSFFFHVAELTIYYLVNDIEPETCSDNKIVVSGPLILTVLSIQSFSQVFPHAMIPFIFWYLPSKYLGRAISVYINNPNPHRLIEETLEQRLLKMEQSSKIVNDLKGQQQFRAKLRLSSPKRKRERADSF